LSTPVVETVFGKAYVQSGPASEHMASYHFDAMDDVYISYAKAPDSWRLDDGALPPKRKYFERVTYDAKTRVFFGIVNWPSPGTFGGTSKWEIRVVFSSDFNQISEGEMTSFNAQGAEVHTLNFGAGGSLQYFRLQVTQQIAVNIPLEDVEERMGVTYFGVRVALPPPGVSYKVLRRFNEFRNLNSDLVARHQQVPGAKLPRKHAFGCKGEKLEKRRRQLEVWLQTSMPKNPMDSPWCEFLELQQPPTAG